jgi:hypothetical protein
VAIQRQRKVRACSAFARADARIRTGDPFITRALRGAEAGRVWLGYGQLGRVGSGQICRVGDMVRDMSASRRDHDEAKDQLLVVGDTPRELPAIVLTQDTNMLAILAV